MKRFIELFESLDSTTSSNKKLEYLTSYLGQVSDEDKLWCIALFTHRRPRRTITTRFLREWAAEEAQIPDWLFEDSYHIVGDLAETISKIIPPAAHEEESRSLSDWIRYIVELKEKSEEEKKLAITTAWKSLGTNGRFLFNKLLTGGFRIGVSQRTMVKALSKLLDLEDNVVAHKLMGDWSPFDTSFEELLLIENAEQEKSKPYPFYLAYALDVNLEELGGPEEWMVEYKWDGIRGQLIKRGQEIFVWSRGEELVKNQYPEFQILKESPLDFVIDGELIVFKDNEIQGFDKMQKRIGRRKVGKKTLQDYPVIMIAYDIMEYNNEDVRMKPQSDRRAMLEKVYESVKSSEVIHLSQLIQFNSWGELEQRREGARERNAEGLMLKYKQGEYKTGRRKGHWFKWKLDPMTMDVVMLYAQRGHGRRANLFTDFTFALKDEDKLVPFAKAYSGLTDEEFREVSSFVRKNTKERFGPVHSVVPELVFEVAFEGVMKSTRHKSGVAVRFPRISRWRKDKPVSEINTLDDLKLLIKN